MKKFKDFRSPPSDQLSEQIVNKAYALSQNTQFNSIRQKISTVSSNIRTLTQRIKNSSEQSDKIDLVADALDEISRMLVIQGDLSMVIKNICVGNIILSDDLGKAILKQMEKGRISR